jgi:YHS domain-containing protein
MMRQNPKQTLTMVLGLAVLFALGSGGVPARAGDSGPGIVTDTLTGVALGGMDPVSYFTNAEPLPGRPDYEYDWDGVPWYFANAADRDIFIRAPEVYAPQFGGHSATSLAQGYLSDGDPRIYAIVAQRLYLFYSEGNYQTFEKAPAATIDAARKRWAALGTQLSASTAAH